MKVFVAGATGVLGRAAMSALVRAGHDVTGVARSAPKAEVVSSLGAQPALLDVFNVDAVATAVIGHEVVCNFATHIPRATYYFRSAWTTNDRLHGELSRVLVDAALATGSERYLQHSAAFMYADGGDRWLDEDALIDPPPHGLAVLAAEESAQRFSAEGGAGVAMRFGLFYGPSATSARDLLRLARSGFVPFPGVRDAYMPFVHVDDLGTAVLAALTAPAGVYNVTDNDPLTRGEMGAEFAQALGRRKPLRPAPRVATRILGKRYEYLGRSQRVSNACFKRLAAWSPSVPTSRGRWAETVDR
jgi:nucleoside-diphosphate-sugar epimerase